MFEWYFDQRMPDILPQKKVAFSIEVLTTTDIIWTTALVATSCGLIIILFIYLLYIKVLHNLYFYLV